MSTTPDLPAAITVRPDVAVYAAMDAANAAGSPGEPSVRRFLEHLEADGYTLTATADLCAVLEAAQVAHTRARESAPDTVHRVTGDLVSRLFAMVWRGRDATGESTLSSDDAAARCPVRLPDGRTAVLVFADPTRRGNSSARVRLPAGGFLNVPLASLERAEPLPA